MGATLLGAAALVLVLIWMAPGDPIDLLPNAEEVRPVLQAEWGLDQPLPVRFVTWTSHAVRGDFGTSLTVRPGAPVSEVIGPPARRSALVAVSAILLALGLGTAIAAHTAGRPLSPVRTVMRTTSIVPLFVLAYALVLSVDSLAWEAIQRGIIDRPAWFVLPDVDHGVRTAIAVVLLAVASGGLADVHTEIEVAIAELRRSPFVDAARARGKPTWPHIARNLAPVLASVLVSRAPFFIGGLVVVEKALHIPGLGALLFDAADLRDYNVALGAGMLLSLLVALARLCGDVVRIGIDPRLRQ